MNRDPLTQFTSLKSFGLGNKWTVSLLLVLSLTFYNYCVELLTDAGIKTEQILFYRGSSALILGIFIPIFTGRSLWPESVKPQIIRLCLNGIASYLVIISFSYLSASTVVLVSRTDVPILIFFSIISGAKKSDLQFWLSFWAVAIIIFLVFDAKFIDEEPIGFLYAFGGVAFTSVGYMLVKNSSKRENIYVISNVFSLSNLLLGALIITLTNGSFAISSKTYWIFLLSAVSQICVYSLGIALYKWYNIERARIPFIIAGLFVMILEMIVEHKFFNTSQIALSILITGMLLTIVLNPASPQNSFQRKVNAIRNTSAKK
ncbi:DMT family transporter [Dyadobacter luticola]|uniref:DMT family transporter n=1 Tax=Dyadobacter luticola TaxID=1979387 RepID=UPI00197A9A36|nr:DMT family transporter [Dyadobacter luticola]